MTEKQFIEIVHSHFSKAEEMMGKESYSSFVFFNNIRIILLKIAEDNNIQLPRHLSVCTGKEMNLKVPSYQFIVVPVPEEICVYDGKKRSSFKQVLVFSVNEEKTSLHVNKISMKKKVHFETFLLNEIEETRLAAIALLSLSEESPIALS